MPNGILSDEFQQRWIPKVVPAFENDLLIHKSGMLIQVCTQTRHVTCIEELHGTAKCRIFNSLLVRQASKASSLNVSSGWAETLGI